MEASWLGSGVENSGECIGSLLCTREVVDGVGVGFSLVIDSVLDARLAFELARLLAAESCIIVNSPNLK